MYQWKWVNFISLLYFDFAYNSRIRILKPNIMTYDSNAQRNATLETGVTSDLKK